MGDKREIAYVVVEMTGGDGVPAAGVRIVVHASNSTVYIDIPRRRTEDVACTTATTRLLIKSANEVIR